MSTLRVFLSSTSLDLEPYRTRVANLVQSLGQFAVVMDRFALRPDYDATSVSLEELRTSDVYILLLAWRYGHIPAGQVLSVTHQEYREARRLGLPCLVFLADDATDMDEDMFLASVRDPAYREQLDAFRAEVRQHLVATFTSVEDLADRVAAALHQYLLDTGRPPRIPRDLPPKVPGFVGRESELDQLIATLRQGQSVGLSALVAGLGGVGKSTLASEALHRLVTDPAFPGGIAWVRCDDQIGLDGLAWVYDQVLAAWGLRLPPEALRGASTPEAETEAREQVLRNRLRLPGPGLLLLDNVELDFPLDRALERLTPLSLTLLITARHRPMLRGLQVLPLDVLEAGAAVRLFSERLMAQGGGWDAERDEQAARIVVERLGRLALAVELAAARAALTGSGAAGLATELQQSDVLERLRDPLNEAASVRYSLERSLALLAPAQRVRFAALGLPDGPDWPRPVVEKLLRAVPPPEAEVKLAPADADLDRLAALSLVTLVSPAAGGAVQVRLHPLLRELATEEWGRQSAEVQQAGLVGLMEGVQAWAEVHQGQAAETYALLEADEALMVGALRRAVDAGAVLAVVQDTALALRYYLEYGGHWRVGVEVWTLAHVAARRAGARESEGTCLRHLGNLYWFLGDQEQAQRCFEQRLAIAREMKNHAGESMALQGLGILALQQGAYDKARNLYEQALAIQRQQGERASESSTLNNLGLVAYQRGDYKLGRRYYEQGLAIAREIGEPNLEAVALGNLGELALLEGDLPSAERNLDQALPLARAIANRAVECFILINRAELARRKVRWEDAHRLLDEVRAFNQTLGSRENESQVLTGTARLQRDQGQTQLARQSYTDALAIYEAIGQAQGYEARKVRAELAALDAARTPSIADGDPKPKRRWWPWRW